MKRKTSILFLLAWNDYRLFQGISRYAHQAGWQMDTRHFFLNLLPKDRRFHGMIAMYHRDPDINTYIRSKAKQIPTVILGTQNPKVDAPMVMPDNQRMGILAAQHLYDLFHKHFGWFACDICPSGKERKNAFGKRLQELGFSYADLSCGTAPFYEKRVLQNLKHAPKPIGVFARDDQDAAVLIELCQEAGLRTPEEVAVIGVGDLESLCAFSLIPISSISANMEEQGYQSAAVLDKLIHGQRVPQKTIIPPGPLIQRHSTGCLALTHTHVKAAVKAIDTRFSEPLTMDDIATIAGVSRRQLYLLFKKEMRCSPYDYILNDRLTAARKLIAQDAFTLNEIAKRCGFNTPRTLNRLFHQHVGVAPSKWNNTMLLPDTGK